MARVELTDREEEIFVASGTEPSRTAEIRVRIAVPAWDNIVADDVIQEYARFLASDPVDAVRDTEVRWLDTGEYVPMAEDLPVVCDECGARSESGWGDTALCLDCEDDENICTEHLRTFVGHCPLDHEEAP